MPTRTSFSVSPRKMKSLPTNHPKSSSLKPSNTANRSTNDQRTGNTRKRHHSHPAEDRISQAEQAITALKRHTERGTCPETLQYRARARIRADNDFKTDIKRIRKNAEQEVLKALTRFLHREIERFKVEIKKSKRPRMNETLNTSINNCTPTESARSAPAENNDVTVEHVKQIAVNIQANIAQFSKMMEKLGDIENKQAEKYTRVFSDSHHNIKAKDKRSKTNLTNKKRKQRKKIQQQKPSNIKIEANKKHIKNLSNKELANDQINSLAKGLKFIPTPVTKQTQIRQQLLRDFNQFARRMRLMYIFHGENNEPHPSHVKSAWQPPIQQSVALESYLEEVKIQLGDLQLKKPKNNLPPAEREALKALKRDNEINLKKADKGTTTVVINIQDKINEG